MTTVHSRSAPGFGRAFDLALAILVGGLMLVLAILGVIQVFFRYAVESSLSWSEELSRFLLIWLVMLAAASEIARGAHITVTILADLLPGRPRRWLEVFNLLLMLVFAIVLTVYGFQLVSRTMSQQATTLPLAMGQVYLALPISGIIMIVNLLRIGWAMLGSSPTGADTGQRQ